MSTKAYHRILEEMQILSGELPEHESWSVMLTAAADDSPTFLWRIGKQLARANNGFVVLVVFADEAELETAERTVERFRETVKENEHVHFLIVEQRADVLRTIAEKSDVDLALLDVDEAGAYTLEDLPCTIGVLRYGDSALSDKEEMEQILVPTAGGPYAAHALTFLKNLPRRVDIQALYISRTDQGLNEEALGKKALQEMTNFADADERVKTKVARYSSATEGIVQQAKGYDLLVMGASKESNLDKVLFGNVINGVVRRTNVPVLVVRQSNKRTSTLFHQIDWWIQSIVPRLTQKQRQETYIDIRKNARPDLDYYVLITLSAAIASLGLIANSTAVVIGAMLVAPLMAPIISTGLSLILGDMRFLRYSLGSALRGTIIAILVGLILGFIVPGSNLTPEVLGRTAPNLLDLGIAVFSGLAGSFALAYPDALGALPGVAIAVALVPPLASVGIAFSDGDWRKGLGAILLFATNFVAITLAGAFVFFVFGFRPDVKDVNERRLQVRSTRVALLFLSVITLALGVATWQLAQGQNEANAIRGAVRTAVEESAILPDDTTLLDDATTPLIRDEEETLWLNLTVRSEEEPTDEQLQQLQAEIETAVEIDKPVRLTLVHIRTSRTITNNIDNGNSP